MRQRPGIVLCALAAAWVQAAQAIDLSLQWEAQELDTTQSVALADYDLDGDLDLAAGNALGPSRLYRNDAGRLVLAWSDILLTPARSVAWGDLDADGDPDLAIGGGYWTGLNFVGLSRVYRNDRTSFALAWTQTDEEDTTSVAWADWNGDGLWDLAAGGWAGPRNQDIRVYQSTGVTLEPSWASTASTGGDVRSLAWADWDGDGDPDLVTGSEAGQYGHRNEFGALDVGAWALHGPRLNPTFPEATRGVSLGDWDGDGDPDLACGNRMKAASRVYRNDGAGAFSLAWSAPVLELTSAIAWGDADRDGDLDLAIANEFAPLRIYRTDGDELFLAWSSSETEASMSLVWGDWDGDGDPDLVVGNGNTPVRIYRNDLPPCSRSELTQRRALLGVKNGRGGAAFRWAADSRAREYHLNSVTAKADLVVPARYRPPVGVAVGQCRSAAPGTTCADLDALGDPAPLLFYQVLSACGPSGLEEEPGS